MDQPKMPTIHVDSETEKEAVNMCEEVTVVKKEKNTTEPEDSDVKQEIVKNEESNDESSISSLKRKIKEEQSINNNITLESPSKRKKVDSKSSTDCAEDLTTNIAVKNEVMDVVMEVDDIYSLLVSNFPETWSFQQICNFVSQSLEGVSVEMEPVLGKNKNELRLTFNNYDHRLSAQNALQDKDVDGNQLQVVLEGPVQYDNDSALTEENSTVLQDVWEKDTKGLYGLKPDYLKSLNIAPPIGNWVHISNFRCDKSELRDVLELAGTVLACSIINTKEKYAKVMYSHPLEAVQAISMLHDQVFYGQKLRVTMDKGAASKLLLPKGLSSVGPGLGEDGNPVREITREYERFLSGKSTRINLSLFTAGNINGIIISHKNNYSLFEYKSVKNAGSEISMPTVTSTPSPIPMSKPNPNPAPTRPSLPRPSMRPNFGNMRPPGPVDPNYRFPNAPMFRGPIHRGPMMRPMGEMCPPGPFHRGFPPGPGPRMPMPYVPRPPPPGPIHPPVHASAMPHVTPVPGTSPNWPNPQPARLLPQMIKCLDATTLKICNLPPTTSFPSLCGKLSTLAQVTSLEFTTPGCAVVKFASPSDAEKCFQNRNIVVEKAFKESKIIVPLNFHKADYRYPISDLVSEGGAGEVK